MGRVIGVVKDKRGCLIDRHSSRARRRVGSLARVYCQGIKPKNVIAIYFWHSVCSPFPGLCSSLSYHMNIWQERKSLLTRTPNLCYTFTRVQVREKSWSGDPRASLTRRLVA